MKFLKNFFKKKDDGIAESLYQAESRITDLIKSKNSIKSELESSKKTKDSIILGLKVELETERNARNEIEEKLKRLRVDNKRLRERLKSSQESENEISNRLDQVNAQILAQGEGLELWKNENIRLKGQVARSEKKIKTLDLELDESGKNNKELVERLREALITIKTISANQKRSEITINEITEALDQARTDLISYENRFKSDESNKIFLLHERITKSSKRSEELEIRLMEALSKIKEMEERLEEAKYELEKERRNNESINTGRVARGENTEPPELIQNDSGVKQKPPENKEDEESKGPSITRREPDFKGIDDKPADNIESDSQQWVDEYPELLDFHGDDRLDEEDIESILAEAEIISDETDPVRDVKDEEAGLTRNERALQFSLKIVEEYNLNPESISVIQPILLANRWSSAKSSIIRLLTRGATIEEIDSSYNIRKFWSENHEFSTFYRRSGEPISRSIYMPWNLALDFVRSFKGLPDICEMEEYLLESIQHWISNDRLHINYPSYLIYLKAIIESSRDDEQLPAPYTSGRLH